MNLFSLFSFVSCLIYLFFGFYILLKSNKTSLTWIFFFLCLSFAVYSLGYFFYYPEPAIEKAWFWYRFSALGWCFFPALALHFCIILTRPKKKNRLFPFLILYILPVFFLYRVWSGIFYAGDIQFINGINYETVATNGWGFWLYLAYNFIYLGAALILLVLWRRKAVYQREKKQALVIIAVTLVSILLAYLSNVLFLIVPVKNIPAMAHLFSLIWISGIWYSIVRYRFMVLTPEIAASEIISRIFDLLFFVTPEGIILQMNRQSLETLGLRREDLLGKPFSSILEQKEDWDKIFQSKNFKENEIRSHENVRTRTREIIPVDFWASVLRDNAGDPIGLVIVGHDLRQMKQLEREIFERKRTEKEMLGLMEDLKRKNDAMDEELFMARKIQLQLIPSKSPGYQIAFYYKPAERVSGDFYDFIHFPDQNRIGIFVSDVSGHGVPAALITSMIKSFIIQAGDAKEDPAGFLFYLNEMLLSQTADNFVTAFYGIYDKTSRQFTYSNAGHNSPFLVYSDRITQLNTTGSGVPLAVLSGKEMTEYRKSYSNQRIFLENNCKLFLYTDGLTEAFGSANPDADFEKEELLSAFHEFRNLPSQLFVMNLYQRLVEFHGSENFDDDVCLICMDI